MLLECCWHGLGSLVVLVEGFTAYQYKVILTNPLCPLMNMISVVSSSSLYHDGKGSLPGWPLKILISVKKMYMICFVL